MKRTNFSIFKRRSSGDPPEAGIDYWMTFLNGVAGRSHNREHAIHSAEILSQCKPMLVGTGGLTLFPGTPLLEEAQCGEFDPLSEKEMLEELKLFTENLTCDCSFITHHLFFFSKLLTIFYSVLRDVWHRCLCLSMTVVSRFVLVCDKFVFWCIR